MTTRTAEQRRQHIAGVMMAAIMAGTAAGVAIGAMLVLALGHG